MLSFVMREESRFYRNLILVSIVIAVAFWLVVFFKASIFPDITEIELYQSLSLNFFYSNNVLKVIKAGLFISSLFIFYAWIKKIFSENIALTSTLLFVILPWNLYLFAYLPISAVTLLVGLSLFYVFGVSKVRKRNKNILLGVILVIILLNIGFLKKYFLSDFELFSQIIPAKISAAIDANVKTQFLSVNQTFLIPRVPRKIMFNYPLEVLMIVGERAVSYFDYEQWAIPLDSYQIIRRSGLLPKGNWQLIYLWQIPVLAIGIYSFFKKKIKIPYLKSVFVISFLVYILSSKRDILLHQILLIPYICILTTLGFVRLYEVAKGKYRSFLTKAFAIYVLLLVATTFVTFMNRQNDFRYTHAYIYNLNAQLYEKYKSEYENIIFTDRHGSSELAMKFYYPDDEISGITFESFNQDELVEGSLYIGLSGEFEKTKRGPRTVYEVIEKIPLWDAPVSEYGDELWIGYIKTQ